MKDFKKNVGSNLQSDRVNADYKIQITEFKLYIFRYNQVAKTVTAVENIDTITIWVAQVIVEDSVN